MKIENRMSVTNSTEMVDTGIYVYEIPMDKLRSVCYLLDQNDMWRKAAEEMGFPLSDIIKFEMLSKGMEGATKKSPSDILISHWGDYNHTVTELFMVLYWLHQKAAMECLKKFVDPKYHCLINCKHRRGDNKRNQRIDSDLGSEEEIASNGDADNKRFHTEEIHPVAGIIPRIPYEELRLATDNWNPKRILGKGGFACVFKGNWKCTDVAIKQIECRTDGRNVKIEVEQSLAELRFANSFPHDNIIPLYGYSIDGEEPCLVYMFMAGGSLESRLRKRHQPLTIQQRIEIAIGTARGLQYLHTCHPEKPLIHGDIKPANILLCSNLIPRIGDFGLAREGSMEPMDVSRVCGTKPYVPKDFILNRKLSTKVDTFGFGAVLFEIITALAAYDKQRKEGEVFLVDYIQKVDYTKGSLYLRNLFDETMKIDDLMLTVICMDIINIGLRCTHQCASERPEMFEVLETLKNTKSKYFPVA